MHAVEREASWRIAKLRVDWGPAIDVSEVAGGGQQGLVAKRAGVHSWWDKLYI